MENVCWRVVCVFAFFLFVVQIHVTQYTQTIPIQKLLKIFSFAIWLCFTYILSMKVFFFNACSLSYNTLNTFRIQKYQNIKCACAKYLRIYQMARYVCIWKGKHFQWDISLNLLANNFWHENDASFSSLSFSHYLLHFS